VQETGREGRETEESVMEMVDDWKTATTLRRIQEGRWTGHRLFQVAYCIACGWARQAEDGSLRITESGLAELADWERFRGAPA